MKCGQCRYYIDGTCYRFPPYGGKSRSRVGKDEIPCGEFRSRRPEYVREDHIPKPRERAPAAAPTAAPATAPATAPTATVSSSTISIPTTTTTTHTGKGD